MQAVILAAGKGSRMKELTAEVPKPMLIVGGKPILQHKLETLPAGIEEVILVVGYLKETIMNFFGNSFGGRKITYVEIEPLGTGYALWQAKHLLGQEFIVMMGDDMYDRADVEAVMGRPWALSVIQAPGFATAADIEVDENHYLVKADFDYEGVKETIRLDTGLYKLQKEIFDTELVQLKMNKEYGLPHTIFSHFKRTGIPIYVHEVTHWLKLNNPDDLKRVREFYDDAPTDSSIV